MFIFEELVSTTIHIMNYGVDTQYFYQGNPVKIRSNWRGCACKTRTTQYIPDEMDNIWD